MNKAKKVTPNPLRGVSFSARCKLYAKHGWSIPPSLWGRAAELFAVSGLRSCLSVYESLKYNSMIADTVFERDPVFIIGHWRSGTTYLHNLLSQDPQWGYPTLFHTSFPQCFFSYERIKPFIEDRLPERRPMDNMEVSLDLPQEDEFGVANLSSMSYYHGLSFPHNALDYFDRYVLLNNLDHSSQEKLKSTYLFFLKKVTLAYNGKPLLLKNPANTARISFLLSMFPNAKFIHIYRNPLEIFYSCRKMLSSLCEIMHLQNYTTTQLENMMIENYTKLMKKYFDDKKLLNENQLIEIRYESFLVSQIDHLKELYEQLQLPGYEATKQNFLSYIQSQREYKKNQFEFDPTILDRLKNEWRFAIDELGYDI